MSWPRGRNGFAAALVGTLCIVCAGEAEAQPLREYLELGRERALEVREQRWRVAEAASRRAAADRALLPALGASASYRRNRREEAALIPIGEEQELEDIVFVPRDEITLRAVVDVPLLDVGAWQRRRAAGAQAEVATHQARHTQDEIARRIAEAYYQHAGAAAMVSAARGGLEAASVHRDVVRTRMDAGLATELDAERAKAQIARAEQTLVEAELLRVEAARALYVLSGLRPSREPPPIGEGLEPEAPLDTWLAGASRLPRVRAASGQARAESAIAREAELYYVPSVSAFAQERYSNAAPVGEPIGWTVGLVAEWRFDLASRALAAAEREAASAARLGADIALRDARADIEDAWQRVRALRTRAGAASAEARASARAAEIARAEYPARASLLDVVLAEQDALLAEIERIRALTDLAYARAELRIASGRADELLEEGAR